MRLDLLLLLAGYGTDDSGDVDGDGVTNVNDLLAVIAEWGCSGTCEADITDDGLVNVQDLLELIAAWGTCG